jgi:hypothetical protein
MMVKAFADGAKMASARAQPIKTRMFMVVLLINVVMCGETESSAARPGVSSHMYKATLANLGEPVNSG